jgi:outer membrane immunogenic protein
MDATVRGLTMQYTRIAPFFRTLVGILLIGTMTAGTAMAARKRPPAPAPTPPMSNWTGLYVGGNVGYSWGTANTNYTDPGFAVFGMPTSFPGSQRLDRVIGGVQIGYNWQVDNTGVFGLETDLQGSGEKGSNVFGAPYYHDFPAGLAAVNGLLNSKLPWFGTARARAGVLITPTSLLYATGGLAYGEVKSSVTVTDTYYPLSFANGISSTKVGWTAGAGLEGTIENMTGWTWKIEYLYLDLGSVGGSGYDADFASAYGWSARVTDNILRVGFNYKWP